MYTISQKMRICIPSISDGKGYTRFYNLSRSIHLRKHN